MKNKFLTSLFAICLGLATSVAHAVPTELLVYTTDVQRQTIDDITFTVELYQEGNPYPLIQTIERKHNCSRESDEALTCTRTAILDLPSKFAPVVGMHSYRVILKPHDDRFPVQVSQEILINHDDLEGASRVLVDPFRLLELRNRLFEFAVQKRSFIPYPKSFSIYPIASSVVNQALRETYHELKEVRGVDDFESFIALVKLWKEYQAITTEELIKVFQSDVRFDSGTLEQNAINLQKAIDILEDEGIDPGFEPPTPL